MTPLQVDKEIERALGRRPATLAETTLASIIYVLVESAGAIGERTLRDAADAWECDGQALRAVADRVARSISAAQ